MVLAMARARVRICFACVLSVVGLGAFGCVERPTESTAERGKGKAMSLPEPLSLTPEETTTVAEVRALLPEGFTITGTSPKTVPDGWVSESATGLRIDGQRGADRFSVWILPRDWIGIRTLSKASKPDPRSRASYWAGILSNERRTTIAVSTEPQVPEKLRGLSVTTPSIVNGGWGAGEKIWRGRVDVAEATAERLIRGHVADLESRSQEVVGEAIESEAARSLIELGVPAPSVFRRASVAGEEGERSFVVGALGFFPSPATTTVLATVLRDPTTPSRVRASAAFAARTLGAPELGDPLLAALELSNAQDLDTQSHVVRALARIRYLPAGPRVLKAMRALDNPHYKAQFGEVLAVLRYRPAEPDLRALAEGPFVPGSGRFTKETEESIRAVARLALIRLLGEWGPKQNGLSLLLVAPKEGVLGKPLEVKVYVEHEGDDPSSHGVALGGTFLADGLGPFSSPPAMNGMFTTDPTVMWTASRDLGPWLATPATPATPVTSRTVRVRYEAGGARSNSVTISLKKG